MPIYTGTAIPRGDLRLAYVQFRQEISSLIALKIGPALEVPLPKGYYAVEPRKNSLGRRDTKRAEDGSYQRRTSKLEDDSFQTVENGLEERLDRHFVSRFKDYWDAEAAAAANVQLDLLRNLEADAAAAVQNTTTFPASGNTGHSAGTAWSSASASPLDDFAQAQRGIRARTGLQGNCLIIGWRTQWDLSRNTQILDRLKYTKVPSSRMSAQELAAAFEVEMVLIGDAPYDSADDGQTVSISETWDPAYASVLRVGSGDNPTIPSAFRTMAYNEDGSVGGMPLIEEYLDDPRRGNVIRGRHEYQFKTQDSGLAYLIRNIS